MDQNQGLLAGRRIVLGVSGGIAAYKAIEVCRRLVDLGAHVIPILTDAAHNMVGPTTFTALASEPVKTSLWKDSDPIPHTRMGQTADAIVVCPATARIISDLRTGRSADLLSATLVATAAPVVVCPAMHTEMWEHPAVEENIAVLRERAVNADVDLGLVVVGPDRPYSCKEIATQFSLPVLAGLPFDTRTRAPRSSKPSCGGTLPGDGPPSASSAPLQPGATCRFSMMKAESSRAVSAADSSSGHRTAYGSASMSRRAPRTTSSMS